MCRVGGCRVGWWEWKERKEEEVQGVLRLREVNEKLMPGQQRRKTEADLVSYVLKPE